LVTAQVPKVAPVITHVSLSLITGGVNVSISGYSTTREVEKASLQFTAAAGSTLNNATVSVPLSTVFSTWYQNSASIPFGSQFTVAVPIPVQGTATVINGVSVTLTNSAGTSTAVNATLQ
jgi:hypothetical protein